MASSSGGDSRADSGDEDKIGAGEKKCDERGVSKEYM